MTALDFPPAFLVVGVLTAASGLIFARLAPDAGAELAGRQCPIKRGGPASLAGHSQIEVDGPRRRA